MNKNIILSLLFYCLPIIGFSQTTDNLNEKKIQAEQLESLNKLSNLYDKGLELTEDSIVLSKEFQKVLNNESYRAIIYPETYTWEQAIIFIENMELKKAFWYFINLYPKSDLNKELVVKSILAYDELFKMDEILANTFYTYSFLDPEVSIIKNGKPEIVHPDILETKLRNVKEITAYLISYRN